MTFLSAWWVYLIMSIIFLYVLTQSFVALLNAKKRALSLGFTKEQIHRTMTSSMIFSLAPSIAILIGLVALSKVFGSMIAGMRLATLGAVTYELPAAINVINGVFGMNIGDPLTAEVVITALWVMTLGCLPPLIIIPFFYKRLSGYMAKKRNQDQSWNQVLMDALFLGMISAFVGYILAEKTPENADPYFSWLGVIVFVSSAIIIMSLGYIMKKYKWDWLKNYALPVSMITAMALAILFSGLGVR